MTEEVKARITGYRQLSEKEQALMNEVKAAEQAMLKVARKVEAHIDSLHNGASDEEIDRLIEANPFVWLHEGKKDVQTASMKLCRAIAQPKSEY